MLRNINSAQRQILNKLLSELLTELRQKQAVSKSADNQVFDALFAFGQPGQQVSKAAESPANPNDMFSQIFDPVLMYVPTPLPS